MPVCSNGDVCAVAYQGRVACFDHGQRLGALEQGPVVDVGVASTSASSSPPTTRAP
jgi:hypothetical protein